MTNASDIPNATDQLPVNLPEGGTTEDRSASSPQSDMFGGDPHGIESLSAALSSYMSDEHVSSIRAAYALGADAHRHQYRRSGEAYISHPVAVARILAEMHMDWQTIAAAILHDVLEDCEVEKEVLIEGFGETVADLVDGVTKITKLKDKSKKRQEAENFSKMLLAMNSDIRVIVIKLADRLHNMRTMDSLPREKQSRKSLETLEIYAPIANRMGMNSMRTELEDLSFKYIHPMRYAGIKSAMERTRESREVIIGIVIEELQKALAEEGIEATVEGRNKHLYGVYSKLRSKIYRKARDGISLREDILSHVNDLYAVRVIVEDSHDCYKVLGIAHNRFRPVMARFKDYIAIPKSNGYQSLHTGFIGPNSKPFELQIRTTNMHRHAQSGIAAHWAYKTDKQASAAQRRAHKWLNNMIEMRERSEDSLEFLQEAKIDLFPHEVYVFTPKGKIIRLPKGATAVDFAYAIHTQTGFRCYGVRIDGKRRLLNSQLESGQTVQVLTDENAHPDPAWLQFVTTGRARSQIRSYTKKLASSDANRLGKGLLDKALTVHSLSLSDFSDELITEVLSDIQVPSVADLYIDIGTGNRLAPLIAKRLLDKYSIDHRAPKSAYLSSAFRKALATRKSRRQPLQVKGTEGMAIGIATCCTPIPGDPITGFLSAGSGLVIHQSKCRVLAGQAAQPERWIATEWADDNPTLYSTKLIIHSSNQRGMLGEVGTAVSNAEADVENVEFVEREGSRSVISLEVLIRDRVHLAEVLRAIKNVSTVKSVTRAKG
jgi:guanosine-3',5'-bis(diphosphate) 3'-pyrophosphohydrolase